MSKYGVHAVPFARKGVSRLSSLDVQRVPAALATVPKQFIVVLSRRAVRLWAVAAKSQVTRATFALDEWLQPSI